MLSDLWLLFFQGNDATKASASYVLALSFGNNIAFLNFLRLKLSGFSQGLQTSLQLGSYQRGSSGLEDTKRDIIFLGHLEKDLQPHQQSPLKKFRTVMTYVVKNACGGCPTVVTQHLQGSWVGILGEGFAEFEA